MDAAVDAGSGQFELTEDQRAIRDDGRGLRRRARGAQRARLGQAQAFPGRRDPRDRPARPWRHLCRATTSAARRSAGSTPCWSSRRWPRPDPAFSAFISIHNMAASMIDRFGSDEQRQRFLPMLTSMEWLASYCLTEPGSGSDAAALKTRAVRDGGDYVLNGAKQFISGAGDSDLYVVMARTGADGPKGISAIVVPKDAPGLSFGANEHKMGWHMQSTRQVDLHRLPGAGREPALGRRRRVSDRHGRPRRRPAEHRRLLAGRGAVGARQGAGLHRRTQGLRPDDQPTSRRCSSSWPTWRPSCRRPAMLALRRGLEARPQGARRRQMVGDGQALRHRHRLHTSPTTRCSCIGGYGYLHDYGVEKLVRDLRVHQILEGTNEIMRVIIARHLIGSSRAIGQ